MSDPSAPIKVHIYDATMRSKRLASGEFLPSTGHLHVTSFGYHVKRLSLDTSVEVVHADRGPTYPSLGAFIIDRGMGDSFFLRFMHTFDD